MSSTAKFTHLLSSIHQRFLFSGALPQKHVLSRGLTTKITEHTILPRTVAVHQQFPKRTVITLFTAPRTQRQQNNKTKKPKGPLRGFMRIMPVKDQVLRCLSDRKGIKGAKHGSVDSSNPEEKVRSFEIIKKVVKKVNSQE